MSTAFIIFGSIGLIAVWAGTIWELAIIDRSDSTTKLEKSLSQLMLTFFISSIGGLAIFIGWVWSYPAPIVNGRPRSEAPQGYVWLGLGLLMLLMVLAGICAIIGSRLKKQRMAGIEEVWERRWTMLYEEFGDDVEKIREIMDRTGLNRERSDAERDGF